MAKQTHLIQSRSPHHEALILTLILALALVGAAGVVSRIASPTTQTAPLPAPAIAQNTTSVSGNIVIQEPTPQATVASPMHVTGRARVFEATIQWRLVDANDAPIATGFATASAGAPEFGMYDVDVPFRVATKTEGYLELFTIDQRFGTEIDRVRLPLILVP